MFKKNTFLFLLLFWRVVSMFGQDASTYIFSESIRPYSPLVGGIVLPELVNDSAISSPINIGFNFIMSDSSYSQILISNDGYLIFDKTIVDNNNINFNLYKTSLIAPFWSSLDGHNGTLSYKTEGNSPNRVFIVEWKNWQWPLVQSVPNAPFISFQARLYERTNKIEYHYGEGEIIDPFGPNARICIFGGKSERSRNHQSVEYLSDASLYPNVNLTTVIRFPKKGQIMAFSPPSCSSPIGFRVDSLTTKRAVLRWEAPLIGNPVGYLWSVKYRDDVISSGYSTSRMGIAENLVSSNDLVTYVRTVCVNRDTSNFADTEFGTQDAAQLRLPYYEGFEPNNRTTPLYWYSTTDKPWSIDTGDFYGGPTSAPEGRHFFALHSRYGNAKSGLVSPYIASNSHTPRIVYKYWVGNNPKNTRNTGQQPLEIAVLVNKTGNDTVVWEHTYLNSTFSNSRDTGWQTQALDLIGFENKLFNIKFNGSTIIEDGNAGLTTVAIDSFRIEDAPSCVTPINIRTTPFAGDSISLSWKANNRQTKWEIEYGLNGFVSGRGTRVIVNSNPFTIRNLLPNANYDFRLRAVCSTTENSEWSNRVSGKTTCGVAVTAFPYYEGFDSLNLNTCWRVDNSKPIFGWKTHYDSLLNETILPANGKGCMRVKQDPSLTSILISPAIRLDNVPKRLIYSYFTNFNALDEERTYERYLVVEISTNQLQWDTLINYDVRNAFSSGANARSAWQKQVFDLSAYRNKIIFIRFKARGREKDEQIFIDDFSIDNNENTCQPPSDLSASGFDKDNFVELAWTKGGNETAWELEYGANEFRIGTGTRISVTGTQSRQILRGAHLMNKEVYVRAKCTANTFTRWIGPIKFQNNQPALRAISAYEDVVPNDNPVDWKCFSFTHDARVLSSRANGKLGSNDFFVKIRSLYIDNFNQKVFVASPRILNLRQPTHRLRFRLSYSSILVSDRDKSFSIGVMSSRKDTSSFETLNKFILRPNMDTSVTMNFVNAPINKDFIIFKWEYTHNWLKESYAGINVGALEWEKIPTCSVPKNVVLDTLNSGNTFAKLSWQEGNNVPNTTATGYNWRLFPIGLGVFDKNTLQEGTITTNTVKINDLKSDTEYQFFVQSFCSNPTDTSNYWTKGIVFRTGKENDDCMGAIPLTLYTTAATNSEATTMRLGNYKSKVPTNNITCTTPASEFRDIWYVITTPKTVSPLRIKTTPVALQDIFTTNWTMSVYKGNCDNLEYVGCNNKDETVTDFNSYNMPAYHLTNYTPNTKYYFRLYQKTPDDNIDTARIIAFCESDCNRNVPNDSCQNAIVLMDNALLRGITNDATSSANNAALNMSCETDQNVIDVWYKFHTETGINRSFDVSLLFETSATAKYAVYKGVCGNLVRVNDCKSASAFSIKTDTLRFLDADQDYFVRVWTLRDSAVSFNIRLNKVSKFISIPISNAPTVNVCKPFASVNINSTNSTKWVSITDETGIVAEINTNGNLLGQVTGSYFINRTGTIRRASGLPYLDRNIGIGVTDQPVRDVSVKLYVSDADMTAYFNAVGADPLAVTHYAGALCSPTALSINGDLLPATIGRIPNGNFYIQFNTRRFSGFLIGPYATLIPVELQTFSAVAKDEVNLIKWTTASEKGNAFFTLERSGDGLDFQPIATIKGKGTTVMTNNYAFEDTHPLIVSYYRLRQTDVNGAATFSKTITIERGKPNTPPRFYPSVTKDNFTVELFNEAKAAISLTNLMGQTVLSQQNLVGTSQLNISHLVAGFYIVSIKQAGVTTIGRITKQ